MPGRKNDNNFFTYKVRYSGLILEFCSDTTKLLAVNFIRNKIKQKKPKNLPDPIKKIKFLLDGYFSGTYLETEIIFIKKGYEGKHIEGRDSGLFLDMNGYTDREVNVYYELLKVKPGTTVSYGELALRSGIPRGARFIGNCMAKNRFPVLIPCHRVIKSDGSIGNFSGGVGIKKFLLEHERRNFKQLFPLT